MFIDKAKMSAEVEAEMKVKAEQPCKRVSSAEILHASSVTVALGLGVAFPTVC